MGQGAPAKLACRSNSRTVRSPPWYCLFSRFCSIVPDTHFTVNDVGDDEAQCTCRDVEVGKNGYNHIVVNPVECFTKIYQASEDSSGLA